MRIPKSKFVRTPFFNTKLIIMKSTLVSFLLLGSVSLCSLCSAQSNTGVSDDLKLLAMHNLNVNTATISTFSNPKIKGTQYLFDQWTSGSVTTTDNETYSANYLFNFDKLTHNLYVKHTSQDNLTIILDKAKVKNFTIGNVNFINASLIEPKAKDVFYQVLVRDTTKISLYKYTKTKFVKADPTSMMNIQTGNFGSEYQDNPTYFVSFSNGELKKVNLSENNMRKVFKDKGDKQLDTFFNMNSTKEVDETLLLDMVNFLNQ